MNAILGLLTGPQSFLIDKVSRMVVRESSNFEDTSSDEQLDDVFTEKLGNRIEQMTKSSNTVDKRLMNLYVVNQAQKDGVHFGFKSTVSNTKTLKTFTVREEPDDAKPEFI